MCPSFAMKDITNRLLANTKLLGNLSLCPSLIRKMSDLCNVCLRQLGRIVFRSFVATALTDHVFSVIRLGAKEKMFGIATKTIVTGMENIESFRYRAKTQFPSNAVRKLRSFFSIYGSVSAFAKRVGISSPRPTAIFPSRHIDFFPKSFRKRSFPELRGTCLRTTTLRLSRWIYREFFSTYRTNLIKHGSSFQRFCYMLTIAYNNMVVNGGVVNVL